MGMDHETVLSDLSVWEHKRGHPPLPRMRKLTSLVIGIGLAGIQKQAGDRCDDASEQLHNYWYPIANTYRYGSLVHIQCRFS